MKKRFKEMFSAGGHFQGMRFRQGSYSSVLIIIVIAIIVIINMAASKIPAQYAKVDVSEHKLYSIGDQTTQLLSELTQDVNIYLICQDGNEDDVITQMLERYESASSHIKVYQKDPVMNPGFAKQYTDESVSENSIIVTCGDVYKYIPFSDMYVTEIDYNTYSYQTTGFDGEGMVTSAIAYVTSDSLPKMYILEGHNEMAVSSALKDRITKENITTETLSLLTMEAVPQDCDILLINAPQNDLSEEEVNRIIAYLDNGGSVFALSDYTENELTNYNKLLEHYGISKSEGIVLEGDANYYYPGAPYYIIPDLAYHSITSTMRSNSRFVLLPSAQGLTVGDAPRENVEVSQLITTSDKAYSKVNVTTTQTFEKEEEDIDGPFALGVAVTEEIGTSGDDAETSGDDAETSGELKTAKMVYVTTSGLLDDTMNNAVSGGNYDFFMNAVSWMNDESVSISIDAKSLAYDYLTVSAGSANLWGVLLIAVVPLAVLIGGVIVWVRRRKR